MGEFVDAIANAIADEMGWTRGSNTTHRMAIAALKAEQNPTDEMLQHAARTAAMPDYVARTIWVSAVSHALK